MRKFSKADSIALQHWYQWLLGEQLSVDEQYQILAAVGRTKEVRDMVIYSAIFSMPIKEQATVLATSYNTTLINQQLTQAFAQPVNTTSVSLVCKQLATLVQLVAQDYMEILTPETRIAVESVYAYLGWWTLSSDSPKQGNIVLEHVATAEDIAKQYQCDQSLLTLVHLAVDGVRRGKSPHDLYISNHQH